MRRWDYEANLGMLRRTSGSVAMRIRLDAPIADAARIQSTWAIRAADLAHWMTSQAEAMAKLSAFTPESIVNASSPALPAISCNFSTAGYLRPEGNGVKPIVERAGI